MGQMSNQWEREGHAKKLAVTVMQGAGRMKLTVQFLQSIQHVPKHRYQEGCLLKISNYL